jgi:hypothetical protein
MELAWSEGNEDQQVAVNHHDRKDQPGVTGSYSQLRNGQPWKLKWLLYEETGLRVEVGSLLGVLDRRDKDSITLLFA